MKTLAFLIFMLPLGLFGMDRLSALSMIETGDNDRMVGSAGEISRYQIRKNVWHKMTTSKRYSDPVLAKKVALRIIDERVASFRRVFHRDPNDFEFYGLWNAPAQVLQGRMSSRVAERCERFSNLCERSENDSAIVQTSPKRPRPKA